MFLRLTQKLNGPAQLRTVWVQSAHIVAIYPDDAGNGCYLELVSSSHPDEKFIQVLEDADQIAQSIGPWRGFAPVPSLLNTAPTEGE
jgi:hypothetical protein